MIHLLLTYLEDWVMVTVILNRNIARHMFMLHLFAIESDHERCYHTSTSADSRHHNVHDQCIGCVVNGVHLLGCTFPFEISLPLRRS